MELLPALPRVVFPAPVVVVVHLARRPRRALAGDCSLEVFAGRRGSGGQAVPSVGDVYFAPAGLPPSVRAGRHALALSADGRFIFRGHPSTCCSNRRLGVRPRALGILLSGASADGADGSGVHQESRRSHVGSVARLGTRATMPRAALALAPHSTLTVKEMTRTSRMGIRW